MTRNCKQGDWAICLGKNYNGRVVRCLEWAGKVKGWTYSDRWHVDKPVSATRAGKIVAIGELTFTYRDSQLRPLRGTFEEIVAQVTAYRLTEMGPK